MSIDTSDDTTDEAWAVGDVSLNTLAWNISSWGDGRRAVPKFRGSNITVPHRPGEVWRPKIADANVLTLGMWVRGCEADGTVTAERRGQFNKNWQDLANLFWNPNAQLTLTRKTRQANGSIRTDTALVEYAGGLEPSVEVPQGAKFTVDLKMADPYFYGASDSQQITTAGGTITNIGDDACRKLTLSFAGSSTGSYVLTNTTTGEAVTVANTGTIVLNTWDFSAIKSAASILGNVSSTGDPFWMTLARGANVFTLNRNTCTVAWQPVYL